MNIELHILVTQEGYKDADSGEFMSSMCSRDLESTKAETQHSCNTASSLEGQLAGPSLFAL